MKIESILESVKHVEEAMQGAEPGQWEVVLFTCLACEGIK